MAEHESSKKMRGKKDSKKKGRKAMRSVQGAVKPSHPATLAQAKLNAQIEPRRRADIHPLDRAINELRSELARSPDDPMVLSRLGGLFYRRGDLAEAETFLRRAISMNPRKPTYHNNLGNVLCDLGRMKEGIAEYEEAIAIEKAIDPEKPTSVEAVTNLELAKAEYRLVHERIEHHQRALELGVGSSLDLNALGCAYLLRNDRQTALRYFREALEAGPDNPKAPLNIAYTHTLDMNSEQLEEATAETARMIARFPNSGRLYIHWAELLENAGLLEEAETQYVRAIRHDPRCLEAYDLLGRLRQAQSTLESRDDVQKSVFKCIKQLEENAVLVEKSGKAAALYDRAFAQVARARFLRKSVSDSKAVETLLRDAAHEGLLPSNSNDAAAQLAAANAGLLRVQMLESEGKREMAMVAIENMPLADVAAGRIWFERGAMALRRGEIEKALKSFEKSVLANPQDAVAYHSLRYAFEGYRRYTTELVRFKSAVAANARDAGAHYQIGMTALSVLRDDEACNYFKTALALDPKMSDAACGLGRALQRQGHIKDAEAAFKQALAIDPENTDAKRYLMSVKKK